MYEISKLIGICDRRVLSISNRIDQGKTKICSICGSLKKTTSKYCRACNYGVVKSSNIRAKKFVKAPRIANKIKKDANKCIYAFDS